MKFYNLLSITVLLSLWLWMPDFPGDYGTFKRLIVSFLPFISINLVFKKIWEWLNISYETDLKFKRALTIVLGFILFGLAIEEYLYSNYHLANDQYVNSTEGGYEAVGNDYIAKGPDRGEIFFEIMFGILFLFYGLSNAFYSEEDKSKWDI